MNIDTCVVSPVRYHNLSKCDQNACSKTVFISYQMTTTAYRFRWISLPALAVECVVCRNYLTSLAMPAGLRNWKSVVHVLLLWKTPKTRIKEGKNDQKAKARERARTSNTWFSRKRRYWDGQHSSLTRKITTATWWGRSGCPFRNYITRAKPLCASVWRPHSVRKHCRGFRWHQKRRQKCFDVLTPLAAMARHIVARFATAM